ncbi:oxalate/formate antiporter family transporter [Meiothermus luteus]|uniref:Oxalate/formate antiporter family transporter n=1 Tax=Meiothermus luteus TaxID=2026184 RepID=A0A399EXS8_9DEIN|nr:MFS transporter [Meiothermus luteus]RIH87322.1 oxalate/formate antiporter family transporter [Meiothermus luteus]
MDEGRGFYGWRIVAALAVTQTVGYGVLYYAFGVFVQPMEEELGFNRAQTAGAFSLALLVSGLAAVPVGRWFDRYGGRSLMALGSLWGALLLWAWAQVEGLLGFYLVWAGLGLSMATVLYETAFAVLAVWFRRQRARALLAVSLAAGLASTLFVPLATGLVEALGWRGALEALALLFALLTVPLHALVLRTPPWGHGQPQEGVGPSPWLALRQATFWWLTLGFALARATSVAMTAHLVPLLGERGYAPWLAAGVAGAVGVVQLLGRLLYTLLLERASPFYLSGAFLGGYALGLLGLLGLPGGVGLWAFVLFFGMANGVISLAKPVLLAETYGARHYGRLSGSMAFFVAIAQTLAPFGVGLLHGFWGGYTPVLWLLLGLAALAALAVGLARPPDAAVKKGG